MISVRLGLQKDSLLFSGFRSLSSKMFLEMGLLHRYLLIVCRIYFRKIFFDAYGRHIVEGVLVSEIPALCNASQYSATRRDTVKSVISRVFSCRITSTDSIHLIFGVNRH